MRSERRGSDCSRSRSVTTASSRRLGHSASSSFAVLVHLPEERLQPVQLSQPALPHRVPVAGGDEHVLHLCHAAVDEFGLLSGELQSQGSADGFNGGHS